MAGNPVYLYRLSDIRRLRNQIREGILDKFLVYTRESVPEPFKVFYSDTKIRALSFWLEPNTKTIVYKVYDNWINRFIPVTKEKFLKLLETQPQATITKAQNYITKCEVFLADKSIGEVVITVPDYLSSLIAHVCLTRSTNNNKDTTHGFLNVWKEAYPTLDHYQLRDIQSILLQEYNFDKRHTVRMNKRKLKPEHRVFKNPIQRHGKSLVPYIFNLVGNTNTSIWFSPITECVELENNSVENTIHLTREGHRIPSRYIKSFQYIKCLCCNDMNIYSFFSAINIKLEKELYTLLKEKLTTSLSIPQIVNKINGLGTVVEELYLHKVPTSSPVTLTIKQEILKHLSKTPNTKLKKSLVKSLIPWPDLLKMKQHEEFFPLCHTCCHDLIGSDPLQNQVFNISLQNLVKQYSANPITYFPALTSPVRYSVCPNEIRSFSNNGVDTTLYLGVELEVTPNTYARKLIFEKIGKKKDIGDRNFEMLEGQKIAALTTNSFLQAKKSGILKFDGSVSYGFEIVTVPGTHKWHTEIAWDGFFKEDYEDQKEGHLLAPSAFLLGWANNGERATGTLEPLPFCGIHVHVSRNALTQMQLGKMVNFMGDPKHRRFIEQVAGRSENNYTKYFPKPVTNGKVLNQIGQSRDCSDVVGSHGRMEALNLNTHKPTVEFRIFRSNVSKAGFMKNLDFVQAFCLWCKDSSYNTKYFNVDNFVMYVEEHKSLYKYFHKWLIAKGFLVTKHKENPEYFEKKVIDIETRMPVTTLVKNLNYKRPLLEEVA